METTVPPAGPAQPVAPELPPEDEPTTAERRELLRDELREAIRRKVG